MHRRTVLGSIAALLSVGGCLSADPPAQGTQQPSGTPRPTTTPAFPYSLSMSEPSSSDSLTPEAPPTVTFQKGAGDVVVTGGMYYGSSTCREISVRQLTLTATDELRVSLGSTLEDTPPLTCTGEMAAARYELVISTGEQFPKRVIVTEHPEHGPTEQRRATPATE